MLPQPPAQQSPARPDARAMLIDILQKAKAMAEQNGIDFEEVVNEVLSGEQPQPKTTRPVPPPPSAPPM